MPRKRCRGLIEDFPLCRKFLPDSQSTQEDVVIHLEEVEAIRLKDIVGLEQSKCAKLMGLSRPTFQRVLQAGRLKTATALTEGRTIIIEGGNYVVKKRVFECNDCSHVWEIEPCTAGGKHGYEIPCPKCGSMKKSKLENGTKHACGGSNHTGGCCGGH